MRSGALQEPSVRLLLCPNLKHVLGLIGAVRLHVRERHNPHNSNHWTNVSKGCEHAAVSEEESEPQPTCIQFFGLDRQDRTAR